MKRLFAILLVITLCIMFFVACDSIEDEKMTDDVDEKMTDDAVNNFIDQPTEGVQYFKSSDGAYVEVVDYVGESDHVIIAEEYDGLPVTHVSERAFENKGIVSVDIPDTVTYIGSYAFRKCSKLTTVIIGKGVLKIESGAFYGCSNLTDLVNNCSITDINKNVFSGCSKLLKNDNGVVYAGNIVLDFDNTVAMVTIREGTRIIADGAFSNSTKLRSIVIPDSVINIGRRVFKSCSNLQNVTLGEGISEIDYEAFSYCKSLQSIVIPDSVSSIDDWAFAQSNNLNNITMSNGIVSIGEYAFSHCHELNTINFNGTEDQWEDITKEYHWNAYTGKYTVWCTDGSIPK